MDWLQRKVKKVKKKHHINFDEWFAENREAFRTGYTQPNHIHNGNTIAKSRKIWIPIVVALVVVCISLAIILPSTINISRNPDFDFSFSDEDVHSSVLADSEFQLISEKYKFIQKLQNVSKEGIISNADDSLVMAVIRGEIETDDNYYILTIQIEYNKNYVFGYKQLYDSLESKASIGEWVATYEQTSIDPDSLYVYLLRMKNPEGQVIYIESHCLENDISYILNNFIV